MLPPNTPLELTPMRFRASSADFDGWFLLNRFPDLWVRRSSGQAARF